MFGTLRFFLACLVAAYHLGFKPWGLLIGVSAVTVFYMISGYVISGLYTSKYIKVRNASQFYFDRFVRIAPQYYFYLLLAILIFYSPLGKNSEHSITLLNLISNFTLIPLGLKAYLPMALEPMKTLFPLIEPTWSLANEIIFYLIAPFVLTIPFLTFATLLVSLCVFCFASQGFISIYQFSYWTLPGPLVFFLIGHFIYQKKWWYVALTLVILFINHLYLISLGRSAIYTGNEMMGLNLDIYVGLYGGLIGIIFLKNFKSNAIDSCLGSISYGCFLCHFLLLPIMPFLHLTTVFMYVSVLLILSCSLGAFSFYCIEKPIRAYFSQRKISNPISLPGISVLESNL